MVGVDGVMGVVCLECVIGVVGVVKRKGSRDLKNDYSVIKYVNSPTIADK